ncbi:glycosyltransferase family 39 protein [Myxococcus sp. K15C18031901]|uniref:glycosyltransferase family 39 protein n=1 Tax=Myxococcus dinghuensis TaxID=2906761 RepID=UPI0020A82721|nr:glycosyltransferase family 39 protein [Myxococcus dinghuensis]MCP3098480.1 glycosyltransferase family 39 protein [Myxococcus dinghuensis]
MSTSRLLSRREAFPIALLAVCVVHVVLGLWLLPDSMFTKYPDSARLLTSGRMLPEQGADFSPLYLLLNVALSPGALRWVQSLAGALGLAAVGVLGARLFSRAVGLVAAALVAATTSVLVYEATLEPDLLVMVLNLGALALLAQGRPDFRPKWLVGAGVLLGLSGATRPTGLAILVLSGAWLAWETRGTPARGRLRVVGLLVATGLFSSWLPAQVIRATVGSHLGATMSAGAVLHMGNRPEGTGLGAQAPTLVKQYEAQFRSAERPDHAHSLYRQFARAEAGADLSPSATELFWMRKTLNFALEEPGTFLGLQGRKLAFFLFGPEGHDIAEVRAADERLSAWPLLSAQVLGLFGLAGLLVALARRQPIGLVALYLATSAALAVGFYVVSRYRLAALPAWALLTGALAAGAFEARRRPRALGALAGTLGACLLLPTLFPFVRDVDRMLARTEAVGGQGAVLNAAVRAGRYDEATRAFEQLQAANPFTALARAVRGVPFEAPSVAERSGAIAVERLGMDSPLDLYVAAELARRAGHCDQALEAARLAEAAGYRGALYDTSLDPALVRADCLLEEGDRVGALHAAEDSLARRGGTLDALAFGVAAAEALPGQAEAQRAAWEARLFSLHDVSSARHARGLARLRWGDFAGALEDADAVLATIPDLAVTLHLRAAALAGLGRSTEALQAYTRALRTLPGFNFPTAPLEAAVATRLAQAPDSPGVLALAAEHHLRAGRLELAQSLAARASAAAPKDAGLAEFVRDLARLSPPGVPIPPPPTPPQARSGTTP